MIRLCILCCFFVVSVVYAETNTPLFKLNKIMAVQKYTQSKIQFTFDVFFNSEVLASAAKFSYSTNVDYVYKKMDYKPSSHSHLMSMKFKL